ncbi:MAG: hypothetical protein QW674_07045 [Candidatus Bathyarchaeia archaeon]
MQSSKEAGKRRTVWLPAALDQKAEDVREKLGLSRSEFYRYAIIEVIRNFVLAGDEPWKKTTG